MIVPRILLIWLLFIIQLVMAQNGYCVGSTFCVYGKPDGNGNIVFTIHSSAQGWCGFGIGSEMRGSTAYLGWPNSTGGITLSVRSLTSRNALVASPSASNPTLLPSPAVSPPLWSKISFSFSRPISESTSITSTGSFIWAHSSSSGPSQIDNAASSLPQHSTTGYINGVDFAKVSNGTNTSIIFEGSGTSGPVISLPEGKSYSDILYVHGIVMILAWGFSTPLGILVARFSKKKLGAWWFRIHTVLLFGVTGGLTSIGIIYIALYKNPPHFNGLHQILGLLMGIGMVCQFILGYTADKWFDPNRTSIPLVDKMHWYSGYLLVLGSCITIVIGMLEYKQIDSLPIHLPIIYGIGIVFTFICPMWYFQRTVGRVDHIQGEFKVVGRP